VDVLAVREALSIGRRRDRAIGILPEPASGNCVVCETACVPRPYRVVDVFTPTPYMGNPVAVVLGAEGLSTEQMQHLAHWTNLSETTFVFAPESAEADYRVRIFTPVAELPFAGHPTLGTCHAWLEARDRPPGDLRIVQECPAGLVRIERMAGRLAFAAPPLRRSGPAENELVAHVADALRIERSAIVAAEWADNGPGWVAVLLASAEAVLAVSPGTVDMSIGLVGPYPPGAPAAFELRAFFPKDGATVEDPVTGSLNASVAQWLVGTGRATPPYLARQGAALGRAGEVHISADADGQIWVGGGTITCVRGEIEI
jgi:PhzF family phenazine biosynthesis protein